MRDRVILSQPLAVDNPQLAENNTSLPEVMVLYVTLYPGDPTEYQTDGSPLRSYALLFIAARFFLYGNWYARGVVKSCALFGRQSAAASLFTGDRLTEPILSNVEHMHNRSNHASTYQT